MARFDGTSSPGPGPDSAWEAVDAALDRQIDAALFRQFTIPPVVPLPFGPPAPLDPLSPAGAGLLGSTLGKLVPAMAAREIIGLAAAVVIWTAAGTLILSALDVSLLSRRPALGSGASPAVFERLSVSIDGLLPHYKMLLDAPPTTDVVDDWQDTRWEQLRRATDRLPAGAVATRLRDAANPGSPAREEVKIFEVRTGELLGLNAIFVTGRVDGALFVAILTPSTGPAALPELTNPRLRSATLPADAHYFALQTGELVAYEVTSGNEARAIPALLGGTVPRMQQVR